MRQLDPWGAKESGTEATRGLSGDNMDLDLSKQRRGGGSRPLGSEDVCQLWEDAGGFPLLYFVVFVYFDQIIAIFPLFLFPSDSYIRLGRWGAILSTSGSFRPTTGSANHIVLSRVIASKSGSRVGGWKGSFYLLVPLLNGLISI
ncbi:unnamed protein product [Cuscuta epithymum]|uniref:Uncharacterized protein n=1 Tax=Cuscuta epithymum TaxID=186058 RepID=A0AAV0GJI0_9ASTE|nr:unnamed protein product [Cuscuta epithymum]